MTIQQCYAVIDGNYDEVVSRLRTDERIKKFLLKVADDKSFELLCTAMHDRDMETAFRAAHTLKGVCLNLSITKLFEVSSELTEALRGKTEYSEQYEPLLENVRKEYEKTIDAIRALD